jgi:hypothetical protein
MTSPPFLVMGLIGFNDDGTRIEKMDRDVKQVEAEIRVGVLLKLGHYQIQLSLD